MGATPFQSAFRMALQVREQCTVRNGNADSMATFNIHHKI
jgi:hypothetical protein